MSDFLMLCHVVSVEVRTCQVGSDCVRMGQDISGCDRKCQVLYILLVYIRLSHDISGLFSLSG
jgi:hypothetical protein